MLTDPILALPTILPSNKTQTCLQHNASNSIVWNKNHWRFRESMFSKGWKDSKMKYLAVTGESDGFMFSHFLSCSLSLGQTHWYLCWQAEVEHSSGTEHVDVDSKMKYFPAKCYCTLCELVNSLHFMSNQSSHFCPCWPCLGHFSVTIFVIMKLQASLLILRRLLRETVWLCGLVFSRALDQGTGNSSAVTILLSVKM